MTHNLTYTAKCVERAREYRIGSLAFLSGVFEAADLLSHDLRHEAAHGLRRLALLLLSSKNSLIKVHHGHMMIAVRMAAK